ncbi:MAG: 50S ribosomal protein L31 [Nitrosopumilus sp. B06]|nr:MAG: 50S ribosomal protein L31 [Nitrosopumilus sp. B06]
MSQDVERVYTINLGKVLLSQSQHRAVRAINMIKEFARHHMKTESIKIEEELAQKIWSRGVRSPPRKIRVRMSKTDEGHILVSLYDEEAESKILADSDTAKKTDATPAVKDPKDSESVTTPDTTESKPDEKPNTTESKPDTKSDTTPKPPKPDEKPNTTESKPDTTSDEKPDTKPEPTPEPPKPIPNTAKPESKPSDKQDS